MDFKSFNARIKELYAPPKNKFTFVDVPDIRFMMIDGHGNPQSDESADAMKWLYSIVHMVTPLVKERVGKRIVYPPIEFIHWSDGCESLSSFDHDKWNWRAMIVFTDIVSDAEFDEAVEKVAQKKGPAPESLRLESFHEGPSVQILNVGDYDSIQLVCEEMYQRYLPDNSYQVKGPYHEIYLNDPSRTAPEKRKTLIRQSIVDA